MGKESITFGDIEVEKHQFNKHKKSILIHDVDISKIVVSGKFLFGKFIGNKDGKKKIRPSFVMLPKTSAYRRDMSLNICLF